MKTENQNWLARNKNEFSVRFHINSLFHLAFVSVISIRIECEEALNTYV